jgi:hypothetical protein
MLLTNASAGLGFEKDRLRPHIWRGYGIMPRIHIMMMNPEIMQGAFRA